MAFVAALYSFFSKRIARRYWKFFESRISYDEFYKRYAIIWVIGKKIELETSESEKKEIISPNSNTAREVTDIESKKFKEFRNKLADTYHYIMLCAVVVWLVFMFFATGVVEKLP
jgi:hypothetical protein